MATKYYMETSELVCFTDFAGFLKVSPSQVLSMELAFCRLIDYEFHVEQRAFDAYSSKLKTAILGQSKYNDKKLSPEETISKASTNDTLSAHELGELNLQEFFDEELCEPE